MILLEVVLGLYTLWLAADLLWRFFLGRRVIAEILAQQQQLLQIAAEATHIPQIQVILFLPMLGEQGNVASLLQAIDSLVFPADRLLVVPITTERETAMQEQRQMAAQSVLQDLQAGYQGIRFVWKHSHIFASRRLQTWVKTFATDPAAVRAELAQLVEGAPTRDVLKDVLEQSDFRVRIEPIHYPETEGNKASQMNYALAALQKAGLISEPTSTYIGVYDADSRPCSLSLLALSVAANKKPAPAFQQYPIYLQDTNALDPFMRNEAWLQTARSVCIEMPRQFKINAQLDCGSRWGTTFTYCIGHGEFLRADWLLRSGFPEQTPIDDLPTGMMLSLAEQQIVPLPIFDFCSVPNSVFDFFRQSANWFEGQSDYISPYQRAKQFFTHTSPLRLFRGRFEQVIINLAWALTGPVRLLMILAAISSGFWGMTLLLGIVLFAEVWSRWFITKLLLDSHLDCESLPRWPFPWFAITRPILKSVGPCLYLLRKLVGSNAPWYKTER